MTGDRERKGGFKLGAVPRWRLWLPVAFAIAGISVGLSLADQDRYSAALIVLGFSLAIAGISVGVWLTVMGAYSSLQELLQHNRIQVVETIEEVGADDGTDRPGDVE